MHFILIQSTLPKLRKVNNETLVYLVNLRIYICSLDSPEIPPSATAHELFRGFSFVNPLLIPEEGNGNTSASSYVVSGRMVDALLAKVSLQILA